jgi:hypothetical protein
MTTDVHKAGIFPLIAAVAVPNDSICDRSNAQILFVTNTNDTGAGSFRQAIADAKNDTMTYVIFRTGGTVTVGSANNITASCIYIAGQTAPGGGFQLKPEDFAAITANENNTPNHIIIRYLRVRANHSIQKDAVTMRDVQNHIWDHVSVNFGTDETWTINNCTSAQGCSDAFDVTLQWSLIGPTLIPHSVNSLVKGADDGSTRLSRVSLHHNLYVNAGARSPRLVACDTCQIINNATYNWSSWVGGIEPGSGNNPCRFDFVRNYWKAGPWTGDPGNRDRNIRHDDLAGGITLLCKVFALRNVSDDYQSDSTANQQNLFKFRNSENPLPDSVYVVSRFGIPVVSVTEQQAATALTLVTDSVGAFQRLDCDGSWLANRDALDDTLTVQVTNGTGPAVDTDNDDVTDYVGIPVLAAGTPCTDSDSDGMPDTWEDANGLNKNDASDATDDDDGDGYINLEEYLNGTSP